MGVGKQDPGENTAPSVPPSRLNVGCGNDVIKGYINLDAVELAGVDVVHDLTKFPWPFKDNRFGEIRMMNVLEHLPDLVRTMEEVWRVSGDGARVTIRVPYWNCWQSIGDPTHLRSFHQSSFDFFDPAKKQCLDRPYYTQARFKIKNIDYWLPLIPIGDGKGWIKISNALIKGLLAFLAIYLSNIIWAVEFELIALKEDRCCRICGSKDSRIQVELNSGSQYFCCSNCKLVYQHPLPAKPVLKGLYEKSEESYFVDAEKGVDYIKGEPWLRGTARFYISLIKKHYRGDLRGSEVMDFGCATGVLLDELQRSGCGVKGIELSRWSTNYAKERFGLEIFNDDLFNLNFSEASFDIITSSHVIEHVTDPVMVLKRLGKWLKPNGLMVIATPDVDSIGARLFGWRWQYYLPDEHLCLFNEESVKQAVSSAGLEVVNIEHYLWRPRTSFQAIIIMIYSMLCHGLKKTFSALPLGGLFKEIPKWRKQKLQYGTSKDGIIVFVSKPDK